MIPTAGHPPDGISPDGKQLYLKIYFDENTLGWWKSMENWEKYGTKPYLILAIDENGNLSFEDAYDLLLRTKMEDLTEYPRPRSSWYLRYTKFTIDGNSYIVKWELPMT